MDKKDLKKNHSGLKCRRFRNELQISLRAKGKMIVIASVGKAKKVMVG